MAAKFNLMRIDTSNTKPGCWAETVFYYDKTDNPVLCLEFVRWSLRIRGELPNVVNFKVSTEKPTKRVNSWRMKVVKTDTISRLLGKTRHINTDYVFVPVRKDGRYSIFRCGVNWSCTVPLSSKKLVDTEKIKKKLGPWAKQSRESRKLHVTDMTKAVEHFLVRFVEKENIPELSDVFVWVEKVKS